MSIKDAGIWDLLDEYADIHDELEDAMLSFEILSGDIELAMEEIRGELDLLHEHLEKCSRRLIRFRRPSKREQEIIDEVREYPFGEI